MELYYVAKLVKVITKILDTTYLPINNPLREGSSKGFRKSIFTNNTREIEAA